MSESEIAVRRLCPGDGPAMRALNALFAEAFADPETYGGAPPDEAYLAGGSHRPMSRSWWPRRTRC